MKTLVCLVALLMLTPGMMAGQSLVDSVGPFHGRNVMAGWADLAFYNVDPDAGLQIGYRLFVNDAPQDPVYAQVTGTKVYGADAVIGNFLMRTPAEQNRDEFICGLMEFSGTLPMKTLVRLYIGQFTNDVWGVRHTAIDTTNIVPDTARVDVRMAAGAFFRDEAKGFAIAYPVFDGTERLKVRLFRLDSLTYLPTLISSTFDGTVPRSSGSQAFFDVTAGDFDGDGLDEVLTVKTVRAAWRPAPDSAKRLNVRFSFHLYDVDWTTGALVSKHAEEIEWPITLNEQQDYYHPGAINQLTLSSGDLNGDGIDEVIVGFSVGHKGLTETYVSGWCQPIVINRDLSGWSIDLSKRIILKPWNVRFPFDISSALFPPATAGLSLTTADLDNRGIDELACGWMDKTYVYRFGPDLSSHAVDSLVNYTKVDYMTHHSLTIADIDADTVSADPRWSPEIIASGFRDPPYMGIYQSEANSYSISTIGWTDTNKTNIKVIQRHVDPSVSDMTPSHRAGGGIFAGHLRGNGIRFGVPRKHRLEKIVEPLVILNAPPVHIDVIADSTYDICRAYPISSDSLKWETRYASTVTNGATASTTSNADWSVSSTVSSGGQVFGIGVKASLTAKYGEKFSKTAMTENTTTIREVQTALWDDMLLTSTTNYDIWEYPVYVKGIYKTDVVSVIPHVLGMHWTAANQSADGAEVPMQHEPGNLLSYLDRDDPGTAPGAGTVIAKKNYTDIIPGGGTNSWAVDYSTLTSLSAQTTRTYGLSSSLSIGGPLFQVKVEGKYNNESLQLHTTTLKNEISMGTTFGTLKPSYSSAIYSVFPYTCWSAEGPLMIDYLVRLPITTPGGSFWNDHYTSKPDLTFNCFYRHRTKKNSTMAPAMEQWTKEIRLFPADPTPGDTVQVSVSVRNYSLKPTTGPVSVRLSCGPLSSPGRVIRSVDGDSVFTTSSPVAARERQDISFRWRVPTGLSAAEDTIVAMADPGNAVEELRKDNNRAWNVFLLHDHATDVAPAEVVTGFTLSQNYPNPFNPATRIELSLADRQHTTVVVFDLLGRKIVTLMDEMKEPGRYTLTWNASGMASGVYFYRIKAGTFVQTKKALLMK